MGNVGAVSSKDADIGFPGVEGVIAVPHKSSLADC